MHEFREVVALGAKRLTDKQKKKIVADYVQLQSFRAAARQNGVSDATVRKLVKGEPESARMCAQKKKENAQEMLSYMESKKERVQEIIDVYLGELTDQEKLEGATLQQITTALGTLIDKWTAIDDRRQKADAENSGTTANENRLFELLAPQFLPTWQKIMRGEADEALEKGGRGSTKSSFCSIGIGKLLQMHPDCNAVCIRRVGNTLRTSVYAQMQWALDQLEPGVWKCTVSPMEMTNRNTGQKILFFGLDDPGKLKSIKLPHGYIGVLWFEELDQYDGPEQIRNVEQSCLRGGDFSFTFKSFNPPASPRNWANRYALEVRDRKIIQHSDYTMVPQEWLGRRFIDDAEDLKKRNPIAYNHEYLGEVTGCGKEIFANIKAERIDPSRFERKYHGVDWGWYPDPWAYNCMSYDPARKTLYIYDELTRRRTRNEDTFKLLQERKVMADPETERLTADSAENKSCGDYTEWGITCLPAIKGPNSIGQGIKWLQSITIVIDPEKCPDTLKEFTEYEYDADKNGDPLPGYPDHDNHHIDAVRYACESIWREPGA